MTHTCLLNLKIRKTQRKCFELVSTKFKNEPSELPCLHCTPLGNSFLTKNFEKKLNPWSDKKMTLEKTKQIVCDRLSFNFENF